MRRFRAAAAGEVPDRMVAEGRRLAAEVLAAGCEVLEFAWSPRLRAGPGGEELLARLRGTGAAEVECSERTLARLSHLETDQGLSLILRRPAADPSALLGGGGPALVVGAAGLRDPGNIGALVRTAEAAGATGLLTLRGSADPFRDKAVRGSAGSILRLPCRAGLTAEELLGFAREHRLQVVVAEGPGGTPCWDADLRPPTLLLVGAEGAGVPEALLAAADLRVGVPVEPSVESLNVAVAAGVLLFEARRQRRGDPR